MKVTRSLVHRGQVAYPVLTIGNFDGQHRGHLALLEAVVKAARDKGGVAMVLTFDPHPCQVLSPGSEFRFLMTQEEKLARFEEAGIDEVLCVEFNQRFAALTPEEFVFQILKEAIGVRELFVGEQFAFGRGRSGSLADLRQLGAQAGFIVHAVPAVQVDGEVVSSTRIRTLVQAGEVRKAARCLGRPYSIGGTVIEGTHRGEALGWPTANIRLPLDRVIPADGVYASTTIWQDRRDQSVAYIGTRPTFGPGERLLEVYLLDKRVDLYGQDIQVQFIERLRDDMVFRTAEELSACIDQDVRLARERLKAAADVLADE